MAAMTFHPISSATLLACDKCGCIVGSDNRERDAHQHWHDERDEIVVDLTVVRDRLSA